MAVYTGNLIAFLSVLRITLPVNSLEDLAAHAEYGLGVQAGTSLEQLFHVRRHKNKK